MVNVNSWGTFDCVLSFGSSSSMSPMTYINKTPVIFSPQKTSLDVKRAYNTFITFTNVPKKKVSHAIRTCNDDKHVCVCVCSFVSGTGVENGENVHLYPKPNIQRKGREIRKSFACVEILRSKYLSSQTRLLIINLRYRQYLLNMVMIF